MVQKHKNAVERPNYLKKLYKKYVFFVAQHVVHRYGLPVGLLIHSVCSCLLFVFTYHHGDDGLTWSLNTVGTLGAETVFFFFVCVLFLGLWFSPLELWHIQRPDRRDPSQGTQQAEAKHHLTRGGAGGILARRTSLSDSGAQDLTFTEALTAEEKGLPVAKMKKIIMGKYIPDPTRREFGVVQLH